MKAAGLLICLVYSMFQNLLGFNFGKAERGDRIICKTVFTFVAFSELLLSQMCMLRPPTPPDILNTIVSF